MTLRADLDELLASHLPADEKERIDLLRMIEHSRTLPQPFSRAQLVAHVTGSAVVVDPPGQRVCLVHHRKLERWLQPGGHAEPSDGGSLEATARREAAEETGCQVKPHPTAPRPLDIDAHPIAERGDEPAHIHLDVRFLLVASNPEALAHDPAESFGAQWLSWPAAQERADEPALRRLLEKAERACR